MEFSINQSVELLQRTPDTLFSLLSGLSEKWTHQNEGNDTWSPYDIVGHLIHGEKTDWISRMRIIFSDAPDKTFVPFDRFAQFEASQGKTLTELLQEFKSLRIKNLEELTATNINVDQLKLEGIHPDFGTVTLSELLATWVVHDLNHLAQISRVMAYQYKDAVGPWRTYLTILK